MNIETDKRKEYFRKAMQKQRSNPAYKEKESKAKQIKYNEDKEANREKARLRK